MPTLLPELEKKYILHICKREVLRPLRDQVLRISGFEVDSTLSWEDGIRMFWSRHYDLILVDVEDESDVPHSNHFCSEVKQANPEQIVAFVCDWRVAVMTECPDEILRTEFDPQRFVSGVKKLIKEG